MTHLPLCLHSYTAGRRARNQQQHKGTLTDRKNIAVQAPLKHGLALQHGRLHCPHTVRKQKKWHISHCVSTVTEQDGEPANYNTTKRHLQTAKILRCRRPWGSNCPTLQRGRAGCGLGLRDWNMEKYASGDFEEEGEFSKNIFLTRRIACCSFFTVVMS